MNKIGHIGLKCMKSRAEQVGGRLDFINLKKGLKVKVEVVFTDSAIESITVLEHGETPGLSDPAIADVPANMVETQSLDVDVVTGATLTSRAIKYAVADCAKQAGGEDHTLLDIDLDRPSPSEQYFIDAVAVIEKPTAVDGVI